MAYILPDRVVRTAHTKTVTGSELVAGIVGTIDVGSIIAAAYRLEDDISRSKSSIDDLKSWIANQNVQYIPTWENWAKADYEKIKEELSSELLANLQIIADQVRNAAIQSAGGYTITSSVIGTRAKLEQNFWGISTLADAVYGLPQQMAYRKAERYWMREAAPELPSDLDAYILMRNNLWTLEQYINRIREMEGINETDARNIAELKQWRIGVPDEKDAYYMVTRGFKPKEYYINLLTKGKGFTPEDAETMWKIREPLPSTSDLIRMVVREAFVPEMVTEAPKEFVEQMAKLGWTKEWCDRFWTAHWEPMPLPQAYENLWRGYWTPDDFLDYLRIADIHPMWREDILAVAFRPPTVRELGYGYDVGVYTEDDIIKYRRWAGLSEEDAKKAAKALIAYRTEAEREACRREHLRLYALGKETREEFEANLRRLGTPEAAIPLWLERGDLEKERRAKEPAMPEQRVISASEALWAFEHGLRDETWLRQKLADLYWDPERIDLAVEAAKQRIKERTKPPKEVKYKELSLTHLEDLLFRGKIRAEELPSRIEALGYDPEDAKLLAQLIRELVEERFKDITPEEALWAYEHDLRDEVWTRKVLEANAWLPDKVDLAIERVKKLKEMRIKPPKEVKYKELSLSHLEDLYWRKKITAEELPSRIEALGYHPEDAKTLASLIIEQAEERKAREEEETLRRQERSKDQLIAKTFTTLKDENITMYVEGLRTEEQIRLNFTQMDIPPELIDLLVAEAQLKYEIEEKREWKRIYLDAYRLGDIDDVWLIALLLSIPIQPEIVKREYIKARMRKTPRVPLQQILQEYPKLEEEAKRLIAG
jgi:hypothetical protein